RPARLTHFAEAFGRDPKIRLGASAAFSGRLPQSRGHQALDLETVERDVDAADRHLPATALLDRIGNRHPVGAVAKPDQGEQHQEFETAEEFTPRHLLNNTE